MIRQKNKYCEDIKILNNRHLNDSVKEIILEIPENIVFLPGQFMSLQTKTGTDPLLKRPFSILKQNKNKIHIAYQIVGKGTGSLAELNAGMKINAIYPLGNPFPGPKKNVDLCFLVAGGIGFPPIYHYRSFYEDQLENTVVYYGARNASSLIYLEELKNSGYKHIVATDDGTLFHHGSILGPLENDLLENKTIMILACGPEKMLESLKKIILPYDNIICYASFEDYMACGYGVCNGCVKKIRTEDGSFQYKKVCADGPVFDLKKVMFE